MKIRIDFITNSSSSAFVVLKNSSYYNMLQKREDFHFKRGDDITRSTGVYEGKDIMEFISSEWLDDMFDSIYPLTLQHGLENLVIVLISDGQMGGTFPFPEIKDILFTTEYH